ncbi:tRNA uridine-5-carboxymethylaminomethyl(34) synthesis GTPase MnmE [candidate division KSB1 bacterium]
MKTEDTITAISTPAGKGGIGIIRISGTDAYALGKKVLQTKENNNTVESHKACHGYFYNPDTGDIMDEVMYIFMKNPHTYTREDMVEINAHGGIFLLTSMLDVILSQGARLAGPGEFSFRAYMSGRIDLTQAEAVADLIEAESEAAAKIAIKNVMGSLKNAVRKIRSEIMDMYSISEAEIDFADENLELESRDKIFERLTGTADKMNELIKSYDGGKLYRDGIKIGIFGRVNVGKSSLLNAILGKDRVIVSDEPGTTRDTIEGNIIHSGVTLRFVDTAGLQENAGTVEAEGIKRAKKIMQEADTAIIVIDVTNMNKEEDEKVYESIKKKISGNIIAAYNKIDLIENIDAVNPVIDDDKLKNIYISAKENLNIDKLKGVLAEDIKKHTVLKNSDIIVSNIRHHNLLKQAYECVERLIEGYKQGTPNEFLSLDFSDCINYLGEITGDTAADELLDVIFSNFCIGK